MARAHAAFGLLAAVVVAAPGVSGDQECHPEAPASPRPVQGLYGQLPLRFEANQGQADPRVRFLARGSGYALFLTPRETVLALRMPKREGKAQPAEIIRISLVGGNPSPAVEGADLLPGKANYLVGSGPEDWRTDIPLFARVRASEVYPGVGLTYYGNQRQLEYDFEVAPGADPRAIRLRVDGAKSLRLDAEGHLRIRTRHGEVVQKAPVVYQVRDGVREAVAGRFRLSGRREVRFDIPKYDRRLALVIDPIVQWSVYLGGNSDELAESVASDRSLSATYVAGTTLSSDLCVLSSPPRPVCSLQFDAGSTDAFVTKFHLTSSPVDLVVDYTTYVGGDGDDEAHGIAVDDNGSAHITGLSTSPGGFPGPPTTFGSGGGVDAFVVKLDPAGRGPVYSRFLGGAAKDVGHDIAVSQADEAYVVGQTDSSDFPLAGPFQGTPGGAIDAFLSRLGPTGDLRYSTYYGGDGDDVAYGVALRQGTPPDVAVFFVGQTSSTNFPPKDAFQAGLLGPTDAFVVRMDDLGGSVSQVLSSYLGGTKDETAFGVDVDPVASFTDYDFYVAGETTSGDFPVFPAPPDVLQGTLKGPKDAFVTKIRRGAPFFYSTYLGGSGSDSASGIAVDASNNAHVTGDTDSPDFPVFRPLGPSGLYAGGASLSGTTDAFVTKIVPPGCSVTYSTYLGGSKDDFGTDITMVGNTVSVVGRTFSNGNDIPLRTFSLPGSVYGTFQGGATDAFVTSITDDATPDVELRKDDDPDPVLLGQLLTYTLHVKNLSPDAPAYGLHLVDTLDSTLFFVFVTPSAYCSESGGVVTCDFPCLEPGKTIDVTIAVVPSLALPLTNNASVVTQSPDSDPFNNSDVETTTVNPAADLFILKGATPGSVGVGDDVEFDIVFANNGPSDATNVKVIDFLPAGIEYTGFTSVDVSCTPPPATVVTCSVIAPTFPPVGLIAFVIHGRATAPGLQTNLARIVADESDPDTSQNESTADTLVTSPGGGVLFPTVRSSLDENLLEWLNPSSGSVLSISRTEAPPSTPCSYVTVAGVSEIDNRPLASGSKQFFLDDGSVPGFPIASDGRTFCYTIFVDGGSPRFSSGRPFDSVTGRVRWAFNMGTWSMAPPGNGPGIVHAVSNDSVLYAMSKGTSGGKWPDPPEWHPFGAMNGPSQGRPSTYPLPVGTANAAVFLTAQDGKAYAIDADEGGASANAWPPFVLGSAAVAPPSGIFTAFGGTRDLVFAASRETPPTGSTFYALKLTDGTSAAPGWVQAAGGTIGPVHGQPAVDYSTSPPRVYFATRAYGSAPNDKTLWCLDAETGAVLWSRAYGDIDAGVTLRGSRLYVATNAGEVKAIDKDSGVASWTYAIVPQPTEGPAKGFVYASPFTTDLYFASNGRIYSLTDTGASYVENWPGGAVVSSPSTPILVPGDTIVWVGSGDGSLKRYRASDAVLLSTTPLGDGSAAVGGPTFDLQNGFVYVGTEAGIVYAIELPIP